jgi:hypothetical protein
MLRSSSPFVRLSLVSVQSGCDISQLCQLSSWHDWSTCNTACGSGKQSRWRGVCCRDSSLDFLECVKYCNLSTTQYLDYQSCSNFSSCAFSQKKFDTSSGINLFEFWKHFLVSLHVRYTYSMWFYLGIWFKIPVSWMKSIWSTTCMHYTPLYR